MEKANMCEDVALEEWIVSWMETKTSFKLEETWKGIKF